MAKKSKKTLKYFAGKLHLWLGFSTGLVVFIVALTGCLYCFQDEITALYDDYKYVEAKDQPFIPPSEARDIAWDIHPGRTIHGIAYGDKTDAIEVVFYEADPEFYQVLYLNPYNGDIIKQVNVLEGFFHFILDGHIYLWMGEFGRQLVGYSTILFLIVLITGLILWFPRNRKAAGKRIRFKWTERTRWKRKVYDLHNVLAFYASAIAVIIGITGLVMAFNWFQNGFYDITGGDRENAGFVFPENVSVASENIEKTGGEPIDLVWERLMREYPEAYHVEVHLPPADGYAIYAHMTFSEGTYWNADYRYFDSRTLEELKPDSPYLTMEEASTADLLRRMNYDIHVGAIGGLAGKIIAFFSSLIVGSLPVTGFLIWWGRRSSKNNSRKVPERNTRNSISMNGHSKKEPKERIDVVHVES